MAHTYTYLPQDVPSIIGDIVEQLSFNLETELGHKVAYKHGTWKSIQGRIVDESTGTIIKDATFPLICLIQVFEEKFDADSTYSELTLTLLFCNISEPAWYSEDRYANNYLPTLYPMYAEFMQLINESPYFVGYNELYPEHTKIDDLHLPETDANKLPACLDGLWIRNMKLRLDNKCLPVESWVNTMVILESSTYVVDKYVIDGKIGIDDLNAFKNGSEITLLITNDIQVPNTFNIQAGQGLEFVSVVGDIYYKYKVVDLLLLSSPVLFTINLFAFPSQTIKATSKVFSMGNLRPTWINKSNQQGSIIT
jgi:hypothetical protein